MTLVNNLKLSYSVTVILILEYIGMDIKCLSQFISAS